MMEVAVVVAEPAGSGVVMPELEVAAAGSLSFELELELELRVELEVELDPDNVARLTATVLEIPVAGTMDVDWTGARVTEVAGKLYEYAWENVMVVKSD